jgi:hypothetical protein
MFTQALFETPPRDPLLRLFFKFHVAADYASDAQFKLQALDALRAGNHFKRLKLAPEAVERNLLTENLSPLGLYALCHLYGVSAAFVVGRTFFVVGAATHVARDGQIAKMFAASDLLRVNPSKLLYAASHYTLPELARMAATLRLPAGGTKAVLYAEISTYLAGNYNGFK